MESREGPGAGSLYGVVDLGSNTVHLLVGRSEGTTVTPVLDLTAGLRLGAAVDAHGAVSAEGLAATLDTLAEYRTAASAVGVRRLHLFATHAIRVASNGAAVVAAIEEATGLRLQVITPEHEAALAFAGAAAAWPGDDLRAVLDIGGGSAQVVIGQGDRVQASVSLPLGAARLTTRFLPGDPPTAAEQAALAAHLTTTLRPVLPVPAAPVAAIVGVGGTLRRVPALVGGTDGMILAPARVAEAQAAVAGRSEAEIAYIYGLAPERARLMLPALMILHEVVSYYGGPPVVIAGAGVREGAILRLARHGAL